MFKYIFLQIYHFQHQSYAHEANLNLHCSSSNTFTDIQNKLIRWGGGVPEKCSVPLFHSKYFTHAWYSHLLWKAFSWKHPNCDSLLLPNGVTWARIEREIVWNAISSVRDISNFTLDAKNFHRVLRCHARKIWLANFSVMDLRNSLV